MSTDNKNQALLVALQAMQSYDQFGMIPNHKLVINLILQCINGNSTLPADVDFELLEVSSMLMIRAIERAKKE